MLFLKGIFTRLNAYRADDKAMPRLLLPWYVLLARVILVFIAVCLSVFAIVCVQLRQTARLMNEGRKRTSDAATIGAALKRFKTEHDGKQPTSLKQLRFEVYGVNVDIKPFKFYPPGVHKDHLGQDVMAESVEPRDKDQLLQVGWDGELRYENTRPLWP